MAEIGTAEAPGNPAQAPSINETVDIQARWILRHVLDTPGLGEQSKERLRELVATYEGHPERALLEHLREMRKAESEPPA
ncbi:MAG TPA: hypothetical protein VJQ61_13040 [Sinomonas sp.]|nr:hypothetical protein [Sinomonas sp.]